MDGALLEELDQHTHQLRLLDRTFGATSVLDQITSHISLVRQLMTHTVLSRDRRALARIVADASALAGWQALDTAAIMRAWQHFDLARSAGQEADDPRSMRTPSASSPTLWPTLSATPTRWRS